MTRSPSKNPPGQRQLRVGEVVRKTIDEVLRRGEIFDARLESTPVTISEVKMTPDMKQATVFVAPLGGIGADNILRALEENEQELKDCVAHRARLRFVPRLRFKLDESFAYAHKMNVLLHSIDPADADDDAADQPGE